MADHSPITRRTVLKAAPAVAVTMAVPVVVGSAPAEASFGERVMALSPERRGVMMAALTDAEKAEAGGEADPMLRPYRDWLKADADATASRLAEEHDAAAGRALAALREMMKVTPTTMAGIAACAHVLWTLHGGPETKSDEPLDNLDLAMMTAIWRGASGRNDMPEA